MTQPAPNYIEGEPSIHDLVCGDLQERKRVGLAEYGAPLQAGNGRNALQDLYEELLDAACYCRQTMIEWERMRSALDPAS